MREFLSDPLFWMRKTIHWLEVLTWTAVIMAGAITGWYLAT